MLHPYNKRGFRYLSSPVKACLAPTMTIQG